MNKSQQCHDPGQPAMLLPLDHCDSLNARTTDGPSVAPDAGKTQRL